MGWEGSITMPRLYAVSALFGAADLTVVSYLTRDVDRALLLSAASMVAIAAASNHQALAA
jgi:hypothetical protein